MTPTLTIATRPATTADVPILAELYETFRRSVAGERGADIDALFRGRGSDVETSFAADISDPDRSVVVGLIDEVIVGYGVISILRPTEDRILLEVSELFVLEGARGVGVGAQLFSDIHAMATAAGAHGITSRALPGDRSTKNFFESLGLVARSIEVYRDLT